MRKGINRAITSQYRSIYESASYYSSKCVFISHKSEDKEAAIWVAELLMKDGIDVYLDINDEGLQKATAEGNAKKIVECIEKAISVSTHILVLITYKTKESWWVPYEVGYSKKANKHIASLLLKSVSDFPDYLKIERKLSGLSDLKKYSNELQGTISHNESVNEIIEAVRIDRNLLTYIRV